MRSRKKDLQSVWFVTFEETGIGMNTAKIYGKPIEKKLSVSATSGLALATGAGLGLRYSRYITCYDRNYQEYCREGVMAFVDRVPSLDKNGELIVEKEYEKDNDGNIILDDDGEPTLERITYETEPDYMIMEIIDTQRGNVARFGIKKV